MRRRLFAIILLLTLPLFGVVVATPVSAQTAPTIDVTSATLIAKGAAVDVGVTVTCEAVLVNTFISVIVTQRSSKIITQGSGGGSFSCTGQPQLIPVRVVLSNGSAPFKKGSAVVNVSLQACDASFGCIFANASDTVSISK